jgi:CRISPR/Cas system CSM-associated protein Csm3 (group 7 of RAMP superfamily)
MRPPDREGPPPPYTILGSAGTTKGPPLEERAHDWIDPQRISGSIDLSLTTIDPLHMGSGASNFWRFSDRDERLAREIVVQWIDGVEVPVIPGASLKGAIRSIAEALGGGCDMSEPRCDPACAVCAIFGHLLRDGGYLGRAGFDDAHPVDPKAAVDRTGAVLGPIPFQPRVAKGRRIYGANPRPLDAPVPYVVVDRGVSFVTRLHLTNVASAELGLVLLAAGADGSFRLRIGGGKFANMGRVRTEIVGATLRRGYARPAPERLDAAGAGKIAEEALAKAAGKLSAKANEVLRTLRATLGDRP